MTIKLRKYVNYLIKFSTLNRSDEKIWQTVNLIFSLFSGLFYDAYLQEVIKTLEKDPEFRKKMENVNFEDVKIATFSKELNSVAQHVRDELDLIKKREIERIRKLLKGMNKHK